MTKQELIHIFENMDKNELADSAKNIFNKIVERIIQDTKDSELAFNFTVSILANVIAADGTMNVEEFALFAYIIGDERLSTCDVKDFLAKYVSSDIVSTVNSIIDGNESLKLDVCSLAFAVASIDGHVSYDENKLLQYFLD